MIKEALQYIVGLSQPVIQEVNGAKYSDKQLHRIKQNIRATQINLSTLRSLVDYIKSDTDARRGKLLVHVMSPIEVELISELDEDRERETLAHVTASLPRIKLNEFVDQESFIIMMQSMFVDNEDKEIVMKVAGGVIENSVAEYGDDGISQKATIRTGIANNDDVLVPNPVALIPYRTFHEVEQVETKLVFRMRSERGISCALFEADGGVWKNEAVLRIKDYLQQELKDVPGLTVIA